MLDMLYMLYALFTIGAISAVRTIRIGGVAIHICAIDVQESYR